MKKIIIPPQSEHERLVRKAAAKLNPSMPLDYRVLNERANGVSPVKAWTDLKKAFVRIDETWQPEGRIFERKGEISPLETCCRDIVAHELAGHNNSEVSEGCPGTPELNAMMRHFVMKAMKEIHKKGVNYMLNVAQDIVANTIVNGIDWNSIGYRGMPKTRRTGNAGLTEFYKENLKECSEFYEAFVKLNLACWGTGADIGYLRPYFSDNDHTPFVNAAWKGVVRELGLRTGRPYHNRKILSNDDQWGHFAYVITKHLGPLLNDQTKENTCSHDNTPKGVGNRPPSSGKGKSGGDGEEGGNGGNDDGGDSPGDDLDPADDPEQSGNPFDRDIDDPGVQRRVSREFYEKGMERPLFMPQTEALLRLYEAIGDMPVTAKAETVTIGVPVIPYQFKPTDDWTKASLTKFGMAPDGSLQLYEPSARLDIPIHYTKQAVDFPDLVVAVLDRSGSMVMELDPEKHSKNTYIPWGDNSKWHYLLWGWFAMTNDLKKSGKLQYVKNNAMVFSDETLESGVMHGHQIDELRRWLIEHPPGGGGTALDLDKIKPYTTGRPKVILTISDGGVWNWDSFHINPEYDPKDNKIITKPGVKVSEEFLRLTADHLYFHIQIGHDDIMTNDLKKAKRQVYNVTKGRDMITLMRGIIAGVYV